MEAESQMEDIDNMETHLNREQTEAQRKASVLIEALPYIQKFNRKIVVIKYGGSAMNNEELQRNVIKDVTLLKLVGFKPIIVHGGGKAISSWVKKSGKEAQFVNGLRVTDEETMEKELGVKAVGISGKDGKLLTVNKKYSDGQDIGYVGEVCKVRPKILYDLLDNDYLPIVAPVGMDENFDTYNINADEAASAIARSVKADKLVYLTDIAGLYRDINDPDSFINRITIAEAEQLIADGMIGGGMLPKLSNCTQAVRGGVHRVHILDGRIPHSMLLEFFTEKGIGTMFHLTSDTDMN